MLREQGPEQALPRFELAKEQFGKVLGPQHPQSLLLSLNEAVALQAMGRQAEAQAVVSRSEGPLLAAFGATAPLYQSILRLRDRLGRAAGPSSAQVQFFN